MSYEQAVEYLQSLQLFGAKPGLERTLQLTECAGRPQDRLRFVHVAGTNGKGSTCAMLEAIYRAGGLRVGLYTSPHLVSFRERIQVNREFIGEENVVRLTAELREWARSLPADDHPTFFEMVTVMALCFFAEQRCDLVIFETGLGGRLDATNVVTPLASVITNVQFDHEKWLGPTLADIAREKAGIIKPRVPVVTAAEEPALAVIAKTAQDNDAALHLVTPRDASALGELNLRGEHQRLNAALAAKTVEVLAPHIAVRPEVVQAALKAVEWPARLQVVSRGSQIIVLDGAHNPAGVQALADTLQREFSRKPICLILGVLEDKNLDQVCGTLARLATRVITTPVSSNRTASAEALMKVCRAANPTATITTAENLAAALEGAKDEPFVVITGSLYLVGEAMELLGLAPASNERGLNEWTGQRKGGPP